VNPDALARAPLVPVERLVRPPRAPVARVSGRELDADGLARALAESVRGEVRFDPGSLGLYAQDASNYWHVPLGVVLPRTADDVVAAVAACRRFGAPLVGRTGGTSLAGQTSNRAVVFDFAKYMRAIREVDPARRLARVEPGVICDELVRAASPHGLTWGPKPATHSRCGFGGMISNNCGGMHAQYAGLAVHNVEALEVLLYDGTRMRLGWMTDAEFIAAGRRPGREGAVYSALRALRDRYADRIRERFPRMPRRVSGYNLDALLPGVDGRLNPARALVGSEGTCAVILEATLRLVDLRPERSVVLLGYPDVATAGDRVADVLAAGIDPMAVEGMDRILRDHLRKKNPPEVGALDLLPEGDGWLLVQVGGDARSDVDARVERLVEHLRGAASAPLGVRVLTDAATQERFWTVREMGLGATAFVPGEHDTWPGWEDSAVPPERMGDYLRDLRALFDRHGYSAALYGHFGTGCVHCRGDFDLASAEGVARYRAFIDAATELITQRYHGSLSGEHGDGQARAEFLARMFGAEIVEAFREFKRIWDPDGGMNPGKIVDAYRIDEDLRLGPDYAPAAPATYFQFPDDRGSFARATLRCVGVGECRRLETHGGVMCPSYLVTEEERHSTRGRAHLLWEMLRGDGPIRGGFRDESVKEALDLCLACKGCKGDCPVNVDVATYKAEFLAHYYEGRLRPRHAYAFGLIDRWARLGALAPGLANLATRVPGLRVIAKAAAGMHPACDVPAFAPETFRRWFARRGPSPATGRRVLLWPDTFNDHFHPEVLQSAVRVLEHLGFEVTLPSRTMCCGRPLYDYGLLDRAKRYLEEVLEGLREVIRDETPVVVLEPSCASVFRDELLGLLPGRDDARSLQRQTLVLSEFLARHVVPESIPRLARKAVAQAHCHHKSVLRFDDERGVFRAMGLDCEVLDTGCCGMAGAFGFARETHDVAQACGERALLPAVRACDDTTLVLADGFSCRNQIEQGTDRRALHLAQVLDMALTPQESGDPGPHPESALARRHDAAIRRSMVRAGLGVLVTALVAAGVFWWSRRR
jgi:FAD/FMN-containing dehydrogenase/Fe-S oxidoreductase